MGSISLHTLYLLAWNHLKIHKTKYKLINSLSQSRKKFTSDKKKTVRQIVIRRPLVVILLYYFWTSYPPPPPTPTWHMFHTWMVHVYTAIFVLKLKSFLWYIFMKIYHFDRFNSTLMKYLSLDKKIVSSILR